MSGRSSGGEHGNPLQYPCLENSMDRGVCGATVRRIAKSWTWLKWLSTAQHNVFLFLISLLLKYKCGLQFPAAAPSCPECCLEHRGHSLTACWVNEWSDDIKKLQSPQWMVHELSLYPSSLLVHLCVISHREAHDTGKLCAGHISECAMHPFTTSLTLTPFTSY